MTLRWFKVLVAAGAASALALTGCGSDPADPSAPSAAPTGEAGSSGGGAGTLRLASMVEPTSYDPSQAQEGHYMQYYQAVYDSLIRRAPDGELLPMLATDWEYDDSRTVLTVNLRDDVTFSDGAAFDAEAAKANLDHFRTGTGPQGSTLDAVASVDVVDSDTITITLSAPDPALLIYLSNAAGLMGSPEALGTEDIATAPVGSGPYTMDPSATMIGSQHTFVLREGYWDPSLQVYDTIVISPIADTTARYNALASGQADAAQLDARTADQADQAGLVPFIQQLDWQGLLLYDRDGQIVPALAEVEVRQAINYAIDAGSILAEIQMGRGELTNQVFSPSSTGYDPDLEGTYSYDPDRARQLLEEAGYADGFTVEFPTTSVFDPAMLAVISEQLGAVNITLDLVEIPFNDYIAEITSGKYAMAWMSLFQPNTWQNINQVVAPTALWNPFDSTDETVDRLIGEIQVSTEEEAAASAKELSAHLVEQAWFAPWFRVDMLYYGNDSVVAEPQVEQTVPSIYNFRPAD